MKTILSLLILMLNSPMAHSAEVLEQRSRRLKCYETIRSKSNIEEVVAPQAKNAEELFPLLGLKNQFEIYMKNKKVKSSNAINNLSNIVKNSDKYYQCDEDYNPLPLPPGTVNSQSPTYIKYNFMCLPTATGIQKISIEEMQKFVSYLKDINTLEKNYLDMKDKLSNISLLESFFSVSTEKLFSKAYSELEASLKNKGVDNIDETRLEAAAYTSFLKLKPGQLTSTEQENCEFKTPETLENPVQVIHGRSFKRSRPGAK